MTKPLLGVIHLSALPSAYGHRAMGDVLQTALEDARALAAGGVDGVIVENAGDAPYHRGDTQDPVPPDVPAALAVVARQVRLDTGLPVGINCLRNDGCAALGAAAVAQARWVRVNVLTGAYVTDQGTIQGEAARLMAYRKQLACQVLVLADFMVKHAVPLAPFDLASAARDQAARGGADAMVLSGARTGESVDRGHLEAVRAAVGAFPIWIGSGLTPDNAPDLWPRCDGAIVGSAFKEGGRLDNPVEADRVQKLRAVLDRLGA